MSPRTGALLRARDVKSSVASSASTRRRSPSGSTRWIFTSAPSTASAEPDSPSLPAACTPSATATASSSVSMSGGSRYPGRIR